MKYTVAKEINISSTKRDLVWQHLVDLRLWYKWSPWDCLDPESKIETSQVVNNMAQKMSWNGKFSGKGTIVVSSLSEDTIEHDLTFLKPFKSKSKVLFSVKEKGDTILISWTMFGKLPIFLFFLKNMMKAMIGKDFKRGLKRLKCIVEHGEVPAKLEFDDSPTLQSSFDFISESKNKVHMDDLPKEMSESFENLGKQLSKQDKVNIKSGYCFYHKANLIKDTFDISTGYSLDKSGGDSYQVPNHKAIKVTLTGSYDFMEDAWTGIMMHARTLKLKNNKKVSPYEKYVVSPLDTKDPKEYVTEIYFPIK